MSGSAAALATLLFAAVEPPHEPSNPATQVAFDLLRIEARELAPRACPELPANATDVRSTDWKMPISGRILCYLSTPS